MADFRRRSAAPLRSKKILNLASGVGAINNVGSNDGVTGGLGCLGDAAKTCAGVQQDLAAIEVFDLEQPDRDPGRFHVVIRRFVAPDVG
jgi:hypothetical protein